MLLHLHDKMNIHQFKKVQVCFFYLFFSYYALNTNDEKFILTKQSRSSLPFAQGDLNTKPNTYWITLAVGYKIFWPPGLDKPTCTFFHHT